jgi:general secretion pathway protein G
MHVRRFKKAFTLVEILIVVVILGILAAIVVPQFTNASSEAQVSNVESQLQTIRNQVELFRAQNNGSRPDLSAGWTPMISANYLRADPYNPRTNSATVTITATTNEAAGIAEAAANVTDGWLYNSTTGQLWACAFNESWRHDGTNQPWP